MAQRMDCQHCGSECGRDEVHNGVAMLYGPWGCGSCGWSESEEYDCREAWASGRVHVIDGGAVTPRGGWQRLPDRDAAVRDAEDREVSW